MKTIIRFSKCFIPAMIFSALLAISGVASYFALGGFTLGVDFQSGYIYEVQIAPTAFSITWSGRGNARMEISGDYIYITTGSGAEIQTFTFLFNDYNDINSLKEAIELEIEGIEINYSDKLTSTPEEIESRWLVRSAQGDHILGERPYIVHYVDPHNEDIKDISDIREAFSGFEQNVTVQNMGRSPQDQQFLIRIAAEEIEEAAIITEEDVSEDEEYFDEADFNEEIDEIAEIAEDIFTDEDEEDIFYEDDAVVIVEEKADAREVRQILEREFGEGEVVILRSDFVHPRFSETLTGQAGTLFFYTLLLMLLYLSVRFRPKYAIGAIIGIIHDSLIVVFFIILTGMEFNITTIAAILTILGYSINNTVVVFDRIRENLKIYSDDSFVNILNRSLTATLSRTIITTLTTMLAVLSLIMFTTGSMRDFAILLQVGMISGIYTTSFIATGIVNMFENRKIKREKKKKATPTVFGKSKTR